MSLRNRSMDMRGSPPSGRRVATCPPHRAPWRVTCNQCKVFRSITKHPPNVPSTRKPPSTHTRARARATASLSPPTNTHDNGNLAIQHALTVLHVWETGVFVNWPVPQTND